MVYTTEHPPFAVTVDLVVLSHRDDRWHVLLIRRGGEPFQGQWALPGGFVDPDEDLLAAAHRELEEETGVRGLDLRQLGAYGAPDRDPRMRTVSVAHYAVADDEAAVEAGDDAAEAQWVSINDIEHPLAFDHDQVLRDGLHRVGARPGV